MITSQVLEAHWQFIVTSQLHWQLAQRGVLLLEWCHILWLINQHGPSKLVPIRRWQFEPTLVIVVVCRRR